MVRVLLVDDITLSREAVAAQLRRQDWVSDVRTAADAPTTLCIAGDSADVVMVSLGSAEPLELLRTIREGLPDTKLIAIAVPQEGNQALACAEALVDGIVLRSGDLPDLAATVAGVVRGDTVCPPSVVTALFRHVASRTGDSQPSVRRAHLTPREREILLLVEQGLTNKEIARRLGIEIRTVKNHVHNLLEKLRVQHRSEAAARFRGARVPELGALVPVPGSSAVGPE